MRFVHRHIRGLNIAAVLLIAAAGFLLGPWFAQIRANTHSAGASAPATPSPDVRGNARGRPVQVAHPKREAMARTLEAPGTVSAWEQADLFAKVAGYLSEVRVDIGSHVKKGDVLAVIDVPEMWAELDEAKARQASKQSSLEVARDAGLKAASAMVEAAHRKLDAARQQAKADAADLKLKQIIAERQEQLAKDEAVTRQSLDDARAQLEVAQARAASSAAKVAAAEADLNSAQAGVAAAEGQIAIAKADVSVAAAAVKKIEAMLQYCHIVAPFDGVITQRWVDPGAMAQAATSTRSQPLFSIQRIDTVRVFFDVPEPEVPFVQPGKMEVSVQPYGSAAGATEGKVTRYASALDPATRTMKVEVDLNNPGESLKGGMFAKVRASVQGQAAALTIPAEALVTEANQTFVYVVRDGRAVHAPVKVGLDDGARIEITSGLKEDDWVITTGKGLVSAGAQVTAVPTTESKR